LPKYPAIPDPGQDLASLRNSVYSLKEAVELMTGQRRGSLPPVTWEDLLRLGLISEQDIPR